MSYTGLNGVQQHKASQRRGTLVEGLALDGPEKPGTSTDSREFHFMTVASQSANRYLDRPSPSSLADVLDTILDKGLVIDIYVRVWASSCSR